jgi:hypothetical protein
LDKAARYLDEAVAMNPDSDVVYFNRAVVDEERADEAAWTHDDSFVPESGIDAIENAIRLSPEPRCDYYLRSARLLGYAAKHHPGYAETCLDHLREAKMLGEPQKFGLDAIDRDQAYATVRTEHPEAFQEILDLPYSTDPVPPLDYLIDPIDEISELP